MTTVQDVLVDAAQTTGVTFEEASRAVEKLLERFGLALDDEEDDPEMLFNVLTGRIDDVQADKEFRRPATAYKAHLKRIADTTEELAKVRELEQVRDVQIKRALDSGIPVGDIALVSGLSRSRIYQIRDGRR